MRESSPPDAVSATGDTGRPGFGRIRNCTSSAPVGPAGLRAERRKERPQLRGRLAQSELDVAQLVAGPRELRREALERRDGPFRARRETRGALAVLRRDCLRGGRRAGDQLLEVPEPLPLLAELALVSGLEPAGVLDQRA